jgi:hypothetical protein
MEGNGAITNQAMHVDCDGICELAIELLERHRQPRDVYTVWLHAYTHIIYQTFHDCRTRHTDTYNSGESEMLLQKLCNVSIATLPELRKKT